MKKIILYSTPTCPYCRMVRQFFQDHGIAFTDVDVSASHEAAQEMILSSGQMGVPAIIIEEESGKKQIMVGFNKKVLADILGIEER